jgi:catechol 1,2-dioxygenase
MAHADESAEVNSGAVTAMERAGIVKPKGAGARAMTDHHVQAVTSEHITTEVLGSMSGAASPRVRQILTELVRYAHDFVREVRLSPAELLLCAEFLRECGAISDASRHEFILLADVLGITMVAETLASEVPDGAFETSVLGPFYRSGAPVEPLGASISRGSDDGEPVLVHGRVTDLSAQSVAGAQLDVWGTNHRGQYENVDPDQPDFNLRGRFFTAPDGRFEFWTVKPVSYSIPDDGPVGRLLAAAGRHNMRPAHLHVIASAEGYKTVVSELYSADDPYLEVDAVFGVKPSLVVHYSWTNDPVMLARYDRHEPFWVLEYDMVLVPGDREARPFTTSRLDA